MLREIFVNLPIADMARSRAFFEALDLRFNPRFSNEQGACLELGPNFYAMLLVRPFFQGFVCKPVADAAQATEVIVALACDSRAEVDAFADRALDAGATSDRPAMDAGFMYQRSFADLDGHQWEIFWMDMDAAPGQV